MCSMYIITAYSVFCAALEGCIFLNFAVISDLPAVAEAMVWAICGCFISLVCAFISYLHGMGKFHNWYSSNEIRSFFCLGSFAIMAPLVSLGYNLVQQFRLTKSIHVNDTWLVFHGSAIILLILGVILILLGRTDTLHVKESNEIEP